VEFEIVDKTEHRAGALGVDVIVRRTDDLGAGQTIENSSSRPPAILWRDDKLKWRDRVSGIGRIARHTIGRCGASRQSAVSDP